MEFLWICAVFGTMVLCVGSNPTQGGVLTEIRRVASLPLLTSQQSESDDVATVYSRLETEPRDLHNNNNNNRMNLVENNAPYPAIPVEFDKLWDPAWSSHKSAAFSRLETEPRDLHNNNNNNNRMNLVEDDAARHPAIPVEFDKLWDPAWSSYKSRSAFKSRTLN